MRLFLLSAVVAPLVLCVGAATAAAQPGGTITGYRTYGVGTQRFAYAEGVLNPLGPNQQYNGVWIRAYDNAGRQSSEGQINLNNLRFSGGLGCRWGGCLS